MEGKPTFSGAAPESHPSLGPEVTQWREKLGEGPWAGSAPETTEKPVEVQNTITQETKAVVQQPEDAKPQPEETKEAPKAAIDEALTDSKADISEVQAMMGHFFEANKDV